MNNRQRITKRAFDIIFSLLGLIVLWWLIVLAAIMASIETKSLGLFIQYRVGRNGKLFPLFKIKTMRDSVNESTVTTGNDKRITALGKFWRKTKIDELPQLINVLLGQMSFVGPRPDVEGFADKLTGENRIILSIRPGITGPASLKYRNEEELLADKANPEEYNRKIIWTDKVRINKEYIENYSFYKDLYYIYKTIVH
ncbi:sugar transferase [Flexistipes sinusarabici]|nr:sugar transferase [Flexistipes sinusarabici]